MINLRIPELIRSDSGEISSLIKSEDHDSYSDYEEKQGPDVCHATDEYATKHSK